MAGIQALQVGRLPFPGQAQLNRAYSPAQGGVVGGIREASECRQTGLEQFSLQPSTMLKVSPGLYTGQWPLISITSTTRLYFLVIAGASSGQLLTLLVPFGRNHKLGIEYYVPRFLALRTKLLNINKIGIMAAAGYRRCRLEAA